MGACKHDMVCPPGFRLDETGCNLLAYGVLVEGIAIQGGLGQGGEVWRADQSDRNMGCKRVDQCFCVVPLYGSRCC